MSKVILAHTVLKRINTITSAIRGFRLYQVIDNTLRGKTNISTPASSGLREFFGSIIADPYIYLTSYQFSRFLNVALAITGFLMGVGPVGVVTFGVPMSIATFVLVGTLLTEAVNFTFESLNRYFSNDENKAVTIDMAESLRKILPLYDKYKDTLFTNKNAKFVTIQQNEKVEEVTFKVSLYNDLYNYFKHAIKFVAIFSAEFAFAAVKIMLCIDMVGSLNIFLKIIPFYAFALTQGENETEHQYNKAVLIVEKNANVEAKGANLEDLKAAALELRIFAAVIQDAEKKEKMQANSSYKFTESIQDEYKLHRDAELRKAEATKGSTSLLNAFVSEAISHTDFMKPGSCIDWSQHSMKAMAK